MLVKLFVLGDPGSGKSTVARYIKSLTRDEQWSYQRFNDYVTLREMVDEDSHRCEGQRWFRWIDEKNKEKGFDVLNVEAFDRALQQMEQEVTATFVMGGALPAENRLILIEFARNDYHRAFEQFSREFLQNAYFLYLNTDIDVCRQRIRERVKHRLTDDDYYVSDYIFQTYYRHGNGRQLVKILGKYDIDAERIQILDNNVSLKVASERISKFVQRIFHGAIAHAV